MRKIMRTDEFFREIVKALKEKGDYPDILDYDLPTREPMEMDTTEFMFRSDLNPGGSEGIYLSVSIQTYGDRCVDNLGTFKTLEDSKEAMQIMGKLLGDFIYEARAYVNAHYDDFDRRGYSVRGIKKDESETSYVFLADTYEEAVERAKTGFRPNEGVAKAIIRDKRTGDEVTICRKGVAA